MRKQILENAAFEVATQVRTVEDSIDTALTEIAELQARMMRANAVAAVGACVIHDALEQLSAGMSGLVSARGHIVGCHAALVDAKKRTPGLRTTATWGDGDNNCPPPGAHEHLRIVA